MKSVSLKEQYKRLVLTSKQEHLKDLTDEVVCRCRTLMLLRVELPYVINLDNVRISSVHDLTPLLKAEGIECTACFDSPTAIEVTITNFI